MRMERSVSIGRLVQLLLVDAIGTALFVLGIYDGFIASEPLMPASLAFAGYPYVMLGLGILLQIPTIVTFVAKRGATLRE
jgi:hypothetical protein